jgi:hypothetical protein
VKNVRALLRKRGLLTLSELASLVAGEEIRGTWWAHPKGKEIFAVATKLEDAKGVLVAKLVDGKVTYVDERLWPALLGVVLDAKWRRARAKKLSVEAKRLLARVEKDGRVQTTKADAKAKKELEASLLVRASSEHTDRGHHATVLERWSTELAPPLPFEDAAAVLLDHGLNMWH